MTTAFDYLTGMIRCARDIYPPGSCCKSLFDPGQVALSFLPTCRVFYDLVDAMLDHPQANVVVWGPGYEGWDDDRTVQENMNSRFKCGDVDIHINFLGRSTNQLPSMSLSHASRETSWWPHIKHTILDSSSSQSNDTLSASELAQLGSLVLGKSLLPASPLDLPSEISMISAGLGLYCLGNEFLISRSCIRLS